ECRGAGHRVPHIGVAVLEEAGAAHEGLENVPGNEDGADRLIPGPQALGDHHDIRADPLLLAGIECASTAHPAHDLVQDQQYAVAVADLPDAPEVAVDR